MKTRKYLITVKAAAAAALMMMFSFTVRGQFQVPSPDSPITQTPTEDVRTTNSVEYSLSGTHAAGEQYRWEVTGGTITSGGTVTTVGSASVIDFTADAHTITVDWDQAPAGAISSLSGEIKVQKISTDACPSQVQTLPINIWNLPTANITDADVAICSGDAPPATITVELEGAPDNGSADGFRVEYEFDAPDIEDGSGSVDGQTGFVTTNGSSVTIPMPGVLINTVSTADRTFTVRLTLMQDDFNDQNGTYTDNEFVVTVHPVLETGDIISNFSMTRR